MRELAGAWWGFMLAPVEAFPKWESVHLFNGIIPKMGKCLTYKKIAISY